MDDKEKEKMIKKLSNKEKTSFLLGASFTAEEIVKDIEKEQNQHIASIWDKYLRFIIIKKLRSWTKKKK